MTQTLQISHLIKYYGTGSVVIKALDDISFSIQKGEFTAIMGASGSGKSTLLNMISTVDRVSSGTIFLDGRNITEMKERELASFRRDRLGFIFQEYNLLDTLTVRENIVLPLNLQKISAKETDIRLNETAHSLGITEQLDKFPYELSGGQRQRAACARALITRPALILADEPTGALDSRNSKTLMETFRLMNAEFSSTILMVTHDAVVGSYAQRVLFLKDGQIWSELLRGTRSRQELYHDILSVTSALGGDADVR